MRLEGRIALVTGGSRGVGRAIACDLAREGAFVYVSYRRNEGGAEETLRSLEGAGGSGSGVCIELRERQSIRDAFAQIVSERGRIDILVNNAGTSYDQPFALMDDAAWDEVVDVNLTGTADCCRAAIRTMLGQRSGAIVNIASVVGPHASPGQANYAAAKAGIIALTKTLAAEVAARGVRVNAVLPGLLNTGMAQKLNRTIAEAKRQRIPLERFGEGEEVARAVSFLASDDASYIVGHSLVVDGGLTL